MKTQHKVLVLAFILGVLVWLIDAALHTLIFQRGTFLDMVLTRVSASSVIFRSILLILFVVFGVVISRMILKHQRVEEELQGVNRALKVISESDKALVHAGEESALLQEICRIIVETGGYRLAWVGFAEQNTRKAVKAAAQWGEPPDYLEKVNVTWADNQNQQNPTGTAIYTGKTVVVRDIYWESHFRSWRQRALEAGYRSFIALPLTLYEKSVGALNIYAAGPNAFSPEEIKLLSGLADDLAYGIDALRNRTYHKMAEALVQEYYTSIAFLSQTIIDLIGLSPGANIYRYIGHQLDRLIKNVVILISCYDKPSQSLEICEVTGIDYYTARVREILGRDPVGLRFPVTTATIKTLCSPKLVHLPTGGDLWDNGIPSIGIPSSALQRLKELLGIGDIFSIGLQKEEMLLGHLLILVKRQKELRNTEVIETFIHQASLILHRRFIEGELKESENKFRLLAELTPGAIFIHRGKEIIYANQATMVITGYSPGELRCMNFWELFSPPDQELQKQVGLGLLTGEDRQNPSEIVLGKKNGETCWVQVISKAFEFEGETAVMVTAVDISEVKRVQEMEKRHQEQLMQADKMISLGNLVAGVAHEINNPSNAIMVNTPVLMDIWETLKPVVDQYYESVGDFEVGGIPYSEIPASVSDLFAGITESVKRIKTIVEDLKDFARPGFVEMPGEVDINRVLQQSVALLHNMIVKATANFSVEYGRDLPLVMGNAQQLEQVFINLIQNACQALENNRQAIRVFTTCDRSLNTVSMVVEDHGPGIPAKNLKFIMDPFFTTRRDCGGTGLGLSVSSRILQDHKGELKVESTPGKGSTFTVLLPAEES